MRIITVSCFSKTLLLLTISLSVLVPAYESASLSEFEQRKYKHLIEGQGLYSTDDDVEILTVHNFKNRIYGQENAWLIEFYNSWCGFCQKFAPSWKALATDIKSWSDVIKIGAIDCSDDDNSPICRDFEIMGYPTLRYFHEHYEEAPKLLGEDVKKGVDVHSHRQNLVKHMIKEQENGRGKMFPKLAPYIHPNVNHLFEDVPLNTKYVFLILENGTMFGPEVALDLHQIKEISIKYADENHTAFAKAIGTHKFPHMLVLSDDNKSEQFSEIFDSRENIESTVRQFLRTRGIIIPNEKPKDIYTGRWLEAEVPDMSSLMEARELKALRDRVKLMGDVVFQTDLETALRYSLKREVGNIKTISDQKKEALYNYINVLLKYFPFGREGKAFLMYLKEMVQSSNTVSGADIKMQVQYAEEQMQVFSSPPRWLGCQGSNPQHRGYPCGMWTLFHFLTVNAAEAGDARSPLEILSAMHGYIKHFFGCSECSQHFQEMAKRRDMNSTSTLDSAVIWLWMAHNEVNKRLSGDPTEDPDFPKIQFPRPERCPQCRTADNKWNIPEVLKYLKYMYNGLHVRYLGSDTRVLHGGLQRPDPMSSGSISYFRNLDTSMCFILYAVSFLLIVVLIRLFLKKGYRKKMYVHDLLGKV